MGSKGVLCTSAFNRHKKTVPEISISVRYGVNINSVIYSSRNSGISFFWKTFLDMRNILRVGKKFTTLIDLHTTCLHSKYSWNSASFFLITWLNTVKCQSMLRLSWLLSYGSWIYNYLCNQCLSPLMLGVRTMTRCTWYNIMW